MLDGPAQEGPDGLFERAPLIAKPHVLRSHHGVDNPFVTYPGFLLHRAARLRFARLTAMVCPLGVSVAEASVLTMIERNPGMSQVACGRLLGIKRSNMSPLARRLVDCGWVDILTGQGRTHGLVLTQKGQALARRIDVLFEEYENLILDSVSKKLRDSVIPVLNALADLEPRG